MLLPLGPDMVHGVLLRRAPAHCRLPARWVIMTAENIIAQFQMGLKDSLIIAMYL